MQEQKGWYHGHNLPHLDAGGVTQFVTFRLADSIPQNVLEELAEELQSVKEQEREIARIRKIEKLLDKGMGSCVLRNPACAKIVAESLRYLDPERYRLISWVVMPNHVHFLARFDESKSLPKAIHSLKSYTANEVNKVSGRKGKLWQDEYFDRYMRNGEHMLKTIHYIQDNPVAAKLCKQPWEFPWSSAFSIEDPESLGFQPE